jgi:CRISPR-associated protein (TIGR03986 family)
MTEFVNPYSFVPFPSEISRDPAPPCGHSQRFPDRWSGQIDVALTCLSPLLIRGYGKVEKGAAEEVDVPPRHSSGELFVPGSSLHGALRSLHETLAGGCLRVFDDTFVPVYRAQVKPLGLNFRLAVVQKEQQEGVTLRLCDANSVVYVDHLVFKAAGSPDQLRSGARFALEPAPSLVPQSQGKRRTYSEAAGRARYTRDGEWVVLVTDTRARDGEGPCYFAAGRIGNERLAVEQDVLEDFQLLVEGADDLRTARVSKSGEASQTGVHWPPLKERGSQHGSTVIGYRDLASRNLRDGQVLWAEVRNGRVYSLRLAQAWRELGTGATAARIPSSLKACTDPNALCISCRLFGSANTEAGKEGREAVQHSYRGHVRVLDARPVRAEVDDDVYTLTAPGSPKPGAGQFYLNNANVKPAAPNATPARQWGAAADQPTPRQLRGRKMYWTTTWSDVRRRRAEAQDPDSDSELVSRAQPVAKGSTFQSTVVFENLTSVELGSLLAALDPGRWALAAGREQNLAVRLGGGKPLGFGVVQSEVTQLRLDHSASRWLGVADVVPTADIGDMVTTFVEAAPAPVTDTWESLAHLLTVDFVDRDLVQYPVGTSNVFDFWGKSIGVTRGTQTLPLIALPDASSDGADQVLDGRDAAPKTNPSFQRGRR